MGTSPKIIEKLKKLAALADPSRNDCVNETALAAEKIRALLREHGLEMADVGSLDEDAGARLEITEDWVDVEAKMYGPVLSLEAADWQIAMAIAASSLCDCQIYGTLKVHGPQMVFVGTKEDIAAAKATFVAWSELARTRAERLLRERRDRYYDKYIAASSAIDPIISDTVKNVFCKMRDEKKWRASFLFGFAMQLSVRIKEMKNAEREDHSESGERWSLIVQDKHSAIHQFLSSMNFEKNMMEPDLNEFDTAAMMSGSVAAHAVSLEPTRGFVGEGEATHAAN